MGISIRTRQGILWGMLVVLLAGCASLGASREEALRRRVTAFWDTLLSGDVVARYDYEAVSKTGKTPLYKYVSHKGGIHYLDYQIKTIRFVGPKEAEVSLEVKYRVPPVIVRPVTTRIIDRWVKIGGQWYHQERKRKF